MKKLQYLFLLILFLCSFPSAKAWTVSPTRFEIEAEPGSENTFAFTVLNESQTREARFEIKIKDWKLNQDNTFETSESNDNKNSAKSWVQISPKQFVIPPGGVRKVRFTVKVPENLTSQGDHTFGIFVGERLADKPPVKGEILQIKQQTNVAVVVYLAVGEKKIDVSLNDIGFQAIGVDDNVSNLVVLPNFENKGNVHARGKLTLKLKPISYPESKDSIPPIENITKEVNEEVVLLRESKVNFPIQHPNQLPNESEWEFELIGDFGKDHPLVVGKKKFKLPAYKKPIENKEEENKNADTKKDLSPEKTKK